MRRHRFGGAEIQLRADGADPAMHVLGVQMVTGYRSGPRSRPANPESAAGENPARTVPQPGPSTAPRAGIMRPSYVDDEC